MKQPEMGKAVLRLRHQKGLTQNELAEACNIDIRTIQRIEAGEVSPRKHSLRSLANTLGCDVSAFFIPDTQVDPKEAGTDPVRPDLGDSLIRPELKRSFWAGIIFSVNAIPVVYDLTTHSLTTFFHVCTIIIYICSCIFFFKGFYLIGRQHDNGILTVSSLLTIVLLTLVNIVSLVDEHYAAIGINYVFFLLLCINEMIRGIGLLTEANNSKRQYRMNLSRLYTFTGFTVIVQSGLYLSFNTTMIAAGLIISLLSDATATIILYMTYNGRGKLDILSRPFAV